jgi:drug/metabolite transporter (DMT)-like permease
MTETKEPHSPSRPGLQPVGIKAAMLALLTVVVWSGNPVAVRFSVDQLPPIAVAAIRFSLAACFMWIWCRIESTSLKLCAGEHRLCLIMGGLMFAQISLFHIGLSKSSSSHGTVLINTFVIWVAVIEHFFLATGQLTLRKMLGLLLAAAAGLLVIASTGKGVSQIDQPTITGDVILLVSAVLFAVKMVYTQYAVRTISPGRLIFWHAIVGVVLFVISSVAFETIRWEPLRTEVILGLLYQGVLVAGLCFAIQALLLKKHPASQIAVFSCLTPVFGIALSAVFRGDAMSGWLVIGGVCAATGIYLVTVSRSRATI